MEARIICSDPVNLRSTSEWGSAVALNLEPIGFHDVFEEFNLILERSGSARAPPTGCNCANRNSDVARQRDSVKHSRSYIRVATELSRLPFQVQTCGRPFPSPTTPHCPVAWHEMPYMAVPFSSSAERYGCPLLSAQHVYQPNSVGCVLSYRNTPCSRPTRHP